jgi:hypothetical protein
LDRLIFSKDNIDIVANTPEVGEAKESLPVMYKGHDLDLIDEMSPAVIKIARPFLYVLMPLRL